jgi:mono/diheme cytochrome c family protein
MALLLSIGVGSGWLVGHRLWAPPRPAPEPAGESFGMSAEQTARARELLVRQNCMVCHRIGAAGGGTGPDLTDYAARDIRAQDLVVFLREPRSWYPSGTMPAYRNLSRAERALIANYVCGLLGSGARSGLAPGTALDRNVCGPRFLPAPAGPSPAR